jgi:hypothetical protein
VPFPYFKSKQGILSEVATNPIESGPATYQLAERGVRVAYDAKFAHHVSGVVHFSRTGGPDVLPGRKSFPLATTIGRIFLAYFYFPSGFTWLEAQKNKDLHLVFDSGDSHPLGLLVEAEWRRKSDIKTSSRPLGTPVGPDATRTDRKTGAQVTSFFLGPPTQCALRDSVLVLSAQPVPLPHGADRPTMIFIGGLDAHEITAATPNPEIRGALMFLYPAGEMERQGHA